MPKEIAGIAIFDGKSIKISVEYSLEQPSGGVHFVIPEGDGSLVEVYNYLNFLKPKVFVTFYFKIMFLFILEGSSYVYHVL